jgi:hypothetical protein
VVIMLPLSVPLRLVLLPMPVMFFVWAIMPRTHRDVVAKVGPHTGGQCLCANPVIMFMVDVDACARIVIGTDRRIVPVVVIHDVRCIIRPWVMVMRGRDACRHDACNRGNQRNAGIFR